MKITSPKIDGENLAAKASQKAVGAVFGLVLPGFVGGLAQFALKKTAETVMVKRWEKQLSAALPGCHFEGDRLSLDLLAWEATRNFLGYEIETTKYTDPICLSDELCLEGISFNRHGVSLKLQTNQESKLIQAMKPIWEAILDWKG